MNVLVTSAGTASAINVIKALRYQQEYTVKILAVDADNLAAGLYLADDFAMVPKCSSDEYIPTLLQLCKTHQITALYPIYSKEIEIIAEQSFRFLDQGIGLLVPELNVVRRCNDKRRMYDLANNLGLATPRLMADEATKVFPLFAKPNTASGTTNAWLVEDEIDWFYLKSKYPDLLVQEFIEGPEYTVDIICDRQNNLIVGSPRLRLATKSGQSVKGRTVEEPELIELCTNLCKTVGMVGPCNIQFIRRGDEFVFIEVNPRYAAGGLMLTVQAGANLPLLALKLMLGKEVVPPKVRADLTMIRYWEEIFK